MTTWEYLTLDHAPDLAELGRQGWELIAVVAHADADIFYFKRPLPAFRDQVTTDQRNRYYWQVGLAAEDVEVVVES
jgi:hypothetical protein